MLVAKHFSFNNTHHEDEPYLPDALPLDGDIEQDGIKLRSNVEGLAWWENYGPSIVTLVEGLEDLRDVVVSVS